ncbi:P-loop containing nucleoside triphosphate hydrolase protein [Hygrophoropsis aurantiaca]|uniref:P-loop containing nucleoside triphosphate hydrolase protein n=1 Tax=Hygrophoropsis aurantiaca TaxID=72124 RepID=A0ACB8AHG0_9AGAM|nr:P-loop containing nucleoside triphosphate hydrolase protein [Hygrophoropsis aurantiaca]
MCSRAFTEIYSISPSMFWCLMITYIWKTILPATSLYISNRLLFCIELRILGETAGVDAVKELYWAIIAQVACSLIDSLMDWVSEHILIIYGARIKYHFEERILEANLKRDLPTSQDHGAEMEPDPDSVFNSLQKTVALAQEVVSFVLKLRVVQQVLRSGLANGGPIFVALSMLPLVLYNAMSSELGSKAYFAHAVDPHYLRKSALYRLAKDTFKQEVMGGNIADYVLHEYQKARSALKNVSDEYPSKLYSHRDAPFSQMILQVCGELPMLYFAFLAIFKPAELSLVQLAVLEQTASSLRYTFSVITWKFGTWPGDLSDMKRVYGMLDLQNQMKDGYHPYPPANCHPKGMELDIHNVCFNYPGSKTKRNALTNISLSIKPGQLVVIVGANGSGKSTIIKLLNRSYAPASGDISVDGQSIEAYQVQDLRQATANLTQDHQLFPLSIAENIGLGHPAMIRDPKKISEAANLAGAHVLIQNLENGYDTVLQPFSHCHTSFNARGHDTIFAEFLKVDKNAEVSGVLVLRIRSRGNLSSRTFMRLFSDNIRLVTVDEPSSALDPQGELELFERLRGAREGKTMIFVTHRFGHLTKYADLIVCMKEGKIAETGTHEELMAKRGEYIKLYNVQAQAFQPDPSL